MVNKWGRPKKYQERKANVVSFTLSEPFRDMWEQFSTLARNDQNPLFLEYCRSVEGIDTENFTGGGLSLYIRWVLSQHVLSNHLEAAQK